MLDFGLGGLGGLPNGFGRDATDAPLIQTLPRARRAISKAGPLCRPDPVSFSAPRRKWGRRSTYDENRCPSTWSHMDEEGMPGNQGIDDMSFMDLNARAASAMTTTPQETAKTPAKESGSKAAANEVPAKSRSS